METVAAGSASRVEDVMYQPATRTQYRPTASVTGALSEATVGSLVDDGTLATLTSAGTDDAGSNQYDFLVNGVKTGTYTKESKLSDVLDGINSSETAGVNAAYDQETGSFVFTARTCGKDQWIEMGEGLADAMFGPPAGSDRSGESFSLVVFGIDLLGDARQKIFAVLPGKNLGMTITNADTVSDVINEFTSAAMGDATFAWNKYSGMIEARDRNGVLIDLKIKANDMEYEPGRKPDFYTYGQDAIFTAIEVNGYKMPISGKTVSISVPKYVSQLGNDSKFQTEEQVAAAVAGAAHLQRKKVASVEDIDPTAAGADQYIYMVAKAGAKNGDKYDEYMVLDGEVEKVGDWAVDLSGYETAEQSDTKLAGKVDKEDGKGLSSNDFTDADKAKLDSITFATDEEVAAALAEIYGADEA